MNIEIDKWDQPFHIASHIVYDEVLVVHQLLNILLHTAQIYINACKYKQIFKEAHS